MSKKGAVLLKCALSTQVFNKISENKSVSRGKCVSGVLNTIPDFKYNKNR